MSQSQYSDIFPSSTFNDTENIPYFASENPQLFTPEPSSSQQTLSSLNQDFSRPQPPLSIPPLFKRVGPNRRKNYVLYDDTMHTEWVQWWLETDCGQISKINWDAGHYSKCWMNFDQVADGAAGAPKAMCKRCGQILEHASTPLRSGSKARQGTSTLLKHLGTTSCQKRAHTEGPITRHDVSNSQVFTQEAWEEKLLTFLRVARLPFRLIEHPEFHNLIKMAQSAPSIPSIPSVKTIRRRLQATGKERHQSILRTLPNHTKISIALDCWTSPFSQAFMAITGYFIDNDWQYREVLLGFQPLSRTHSGENFSAILLEVLIQHKIQDRVLAITIDNNLSLADVYFSSILANTILSSQSLSETTTTIIRVPCLTHVIQLSLNGLLGQMKANPTNETTEIRWTSERSQLSQVNARTKKRDITRTLNKVRNLAIYINASPQRRDAFSKLQTDAIKLVPLQDVKTRWNSTFLMLRRAERLRSIFDPFCIEYDRTDLMLDADEWRQIDYLLWITQPFFDFTLELSKTKDATTHHVFKIYNKLFEHLERSMGHLERKKVPWKKTMRKALDAAREKLASYYKQTDTIQGDLYAIGTMLAPVNKFQFFSTNDWDDQWPEHYRKSFKKALSSYQERLYSQKDIAISQASIRGGSRLDLMLNGSKRQLSSQNDEMVQYLDSSTFLSSLAVA
ncbi:hypothetical protein N7476_004815 [Penicillium atrosanguineum]|uniref:BED-type domain-containing protein n=1 Tax=Penicillium atrosanguineum TaxID=1132637 RepID=A0A9W9Q037_9EURO|nr:hypothetical protein N7476_004815 [Penicillium atrosanguineum]